MFNIKAMNSHRICMLDENDLCITLRKNINTNILKRIPAHPKLNY